MPLGWVRQLSRVVVPSAQQTIYAAQAQEPPRPCVVVFFTPPPPSHSPLCAVALSQAELFSCVVLRDVVRVFMYFIK